MAGGVDQKATAKYVYLHGVAGAFSGDNDISLLIGRRIAIRVSIGKVEPRATLLVAKTHNRVDQANAVRIVPDDLLCDARLVLELADPGVGLFQTAVEVSQGGSAR